MKMKKNIVLRASEEWTKDDEQKLKSIIIDNFRELLNRSEEEELYWTGTQRDLIELAHIVWESGQILEMNGNPMCFKSIVHHICRVLHVNEPCNPSCVVSEVRLRKNVKSSPLTHRYCNLITQAEISDPMRLEIRRGRRRRLW